MPTATTAEKIMDAGTLRERGFFYATDVSRETSQADLAQYRTDNPKCYAVLGEDLVEGNLGIWILRVE